MEVEADVPKHAESEPVVKTLRGVLVLDVEAKRKAAPCRLVLEAPDEGAPDAGAAMPSQQGDVHELDLVCPAVHVETPGGSSVDEDDEIRGVRKLLVVIRVLGLELGPEERDLLLVRPRDMTKLVLARGGVQGAQEPGVLGRLRPEDAPVRDGLVIQSVCQISLSAGKRPGGR